MNRRKLLKFLGVSTFSINCSLFTSSCTHVLKKKSKFSIEPTNKDDVVLHKDLSYYKLISWNETINSEKQLKFGFNNDYIALLSESENEADMWVNHESVNPKFVSNYQLNHGRDKTKKQIEIERKNVGGSLVKIIKKNNKWILSDDQSSNHRLDGFSKIKFSPRQKICNSYDAIGTFSNCAGGVTPWNTVLTCEENFQNSVGDVELKDKKLEYTSSINNSQSWQAHEKLPPEHYGWVVEYNPKEQMAKKLVSLGRFSHECATCIEAQDGRTVVYMGDDRADQCLYKFISKNKGRLDEGTLYVADLLKGEWKALELTLGEPFSSHFESQQQLLIFARKAARLIGGTPLARPEDIEIHPKTGDIYVSLTNNKRKGNFHGSILKVLEKNSDPLSLSFTAETFLAGGTDFSCPDNLVFDKSGNLWMTSDISGGALGSLIYNKFKNNGLFCIPTSGGNAGRVIQVASAPTEAEFTGPCFSKDGKTLFLSVQHPGEKSLDVKKTSSTWPNKRAKGKPSPTVICIEGPLLDKIIG